jgi:formylglycine-generating enzyme required for sulfatase activity
MQNDVDVTGCLAYRPLMHKLLLLGFFLIFASCGNVTAAVDAGTQVDADVALFDGGVPTDGGNGTDSSVVDGGQVWDAANTAPDAMPVVQGPSCTSLPDTCGVDNSSCCENIVVPGGTYYRSYDLATDAHNDMTHPATISDFRLDAYEITVGRFRAFVGAGSGTQQQPPIDGTGSHVQISASGWRASWNTSLASTQADLINALKCNANATWTDQPGANENLPMTCLTWFEAMAFCVWDGGYLPTEAEWNYAATGVGQRAFPWSNPAGSTVIDSTYAVYGTAGAVQPVGSRSPKGDSWAGHTDLAGNVGEWTLDWHATQYSDPCVDCANLTAASNRVWRGGGYLSGAASLRTAARIVNSPGIRYYYLGSRCARPL